MTFFISAPIFVFREFMRHRIASYNEESGRYRELKPVFYVPSAERKLVQVGKTGAYTFVDGTKEQFDITVESMKAAYVVAYESYVKMLEAGVAREVARAVLPVATYSSMYVTMNARALMNFLSLRTGREGSHFPSYPQREIESPLNTGRVRHMTTPAPFGRLLTAMVTPFTKDGAIDWAGIEKIAAHLVSTGHDGIVVNGTTGEAPTTKSSEKEEIIRVVRNTVGPTIKVLSGAGDNETEYSINQAKRTEKAGADGLLVVTPYYNKPPQAGIEAHFRAVADATDLPMMMYDIPGRTGVPIEPDTLVRLSEHPRIVALKDAKGDVASTSWVIKRCGIPVYSGDDILNLPLLSVGAVGFVSVCGHTVGKDLRELLDSWFAGNSARALEIHQKLLPVYTGTFRTQGAILTKAALTLMGLPGGHTRLPLVDATDAQIAQLREDLRAGGVAVN
jgi:4-hydroxy-tetrahydrodipicolinate synthase